MTGLTADETAMLEQALTEAHADDGRTIIPSNSPTLLIDETASRFSSAQWFEEIGKQTVTLAGVGGIGSYVAFLLSRVKIDKLVMFDPDIVEEANMSGQLYGSHNVGHAKVSAMSSFMRDYSRFFNVVACHEPYGISSPVTNIMMCGFDNMNARRVFFVKWRDHVLNMPEEERHKCLFIDGRLAAEEFQVLCIKGTDQFLMQKYEEEWLFSDHEAEPTLCSYKQTSFCANMIASVMVNLVVNFVANLCEPLIERELPFLTAYDAERMYFKTEL